MKAVLYSYNYWKNSTAIVLPVDGCAHWELEILGTIYPIIAIAMPDPAFADANSIQLGAPWTHNTQLITKIHI